MTFDDGAVGPGVAEGKREQATVWRSGAKVGSNPTAGANSYINQSLMF